MANKAATQQQLQTQALAQLAIIGGQLTKDENIRFEGTAFIFPERYSGNLEGLLNDVGRYVFDQQEMTMVEKVFDYRPYDGAYATYQCLKQFFGYAQTKARNGAFGKEPPHEITIQLGFVNGEMVTETVPWGDMVLPGLQGSTLTLASKNTPKGELFRLVAKCRKSDKAPVDGFFTVVEDFLKHHSIYRGKCINGNMEFYDTDKIHPEQFVYTEKVWAQAETNILSPLRHANVIARKGLSAKRVTLLEGKFGGGKTGLGRTGAKVAVANGVTAIFCTPGFDDPLQVLQTAILYSPCFVFIEDIDILAMQRDPQIVTRILDTFDGPTTKNLPITAVLTTNHVEQIHKGMMRSGRIDATITIAEMDRPGVEKLARIVIGNDLDPGIDFDAVYAATDGFMPAYVKEGYERAVRYTIARTGEAGAISEEDLIASLESLRPQYDLQEKASDTVEHLPPLDRLFTQMIADNTLGGEQVNDIVDNRIERRIDGAILIDEDGEERYTLRTQ